MVELLERPIDIAQLYAHVQSPRFGAVVVFTGVVRQDSDEGRPVNGLTYEAYRELALAEMEQIATEVHTRWDPCAVAMQHRTGTLGIGEPSVVVAVATPHRPEAFAACRYAIDELKSRVSIWKQEHLAAGQTVWRENLH